MFRKWDAYQVYLLIQFVATFAMTMSFAVNMYYQVTVVGLTPLQLVLVGTTLEVTILLFEIPTGVVADVYSRRLSVIIGYLIIGIGRAMEGIPTFEWVLLAQVLWGLGHTFTSGAESAWIVDEIGNERANRAFVRGGQISQFASILGIFAGVGLASLQINFPQFACGVIMVMLGILLANIMPENGFTGTKPNERETWGALFKQLNDGVKVIRVRPILLMIVLTSLIIGLFSEGWDRLHTAHLIDTIGLPQIAGITPVMWFGFLNLVASVLSIGVGEYLHRRNIQKHDSLSRWLLLANTFVVVGVIGFAWVGQAWVAFIMIWLVAIMRTAMGPLYNAWMNNQIDSNVRATVLSIESQANAFGQIAGGPPIGYVANLASTGIAITVSGLLLVPGLWLINRIRSMSNPIAIAVESDS